jgi:hypothetical protein
LKARQTAIAPNQVNEYVAALADAFVVHRVGRYDIVGKRLFERGEKYYFENMGIRNVIAGYKPQDRARRLENVVYNHLLFAGFDVKVGALAAEEVDFVCTRRGETLYVQVSVGLSRQETVGRELGNLLKIKDSYPKIVVSGERSFGNTYEGVAHVYIRDFSFFHPAGQLLLPRLARKAFGKNRSKSRRSQRKEEDVVAVRHPKQNYSKFLRNILFVERSFVPLNFHLKRVMVTTANIAKPSVNVYCGMQLVTLA